MIHAYGSTGPRIYPSAFVELSAHVIGDVELGEDSSVWFGTALRADVNAIRIGRASTVQDGSIVRDLDPIRRSAMNDVALENDHRAGAPR